MAAGIGVCTVHFGEAAVPSCVLPVGQAQGVAITTIEGLANDGRLHRVQQAWLDAEVSQCGWAGLTTSPLGSSEALHLWLSQPGVVEPPA
jgi:aerobic-type carbon monoxide dehydrogenase small subunit (CoxS/CutS family)